MVMLVIYFLVGAIAAFSMVAVFALIRINAIVGPTPRPRLRLRDR